MDLVGRMMSEQLDFKKIRKDYMFQAYKTNIEKVLKETQLDRVKKQLAGMLKINANVSQKKEKNELLEQFEKTKIQRRKVKNLSPKQLFFERAKKRELSTITPVSAIFRQASRD